MNDCIFCNGLDEGRILFRTDRWVAVLDAFPVTRGHTLLIPVRHVETYMELSQEEALTLRQSVMRVVGMLRDMYHPDGFNIGVNCGTAAGQTVMHCHVHVIPRYHGDCANPRGGVRGVIPGMRDYNAEAIMTKNESGNEE